MWEPPESWLGLPGSGPGTRGLWLVPGEVELVAKRLERPGPDADAASWQPHDSSYWCREALVAGSGLLNDTAGFRAPHVWDVAEDADGITIFSERVTRSVIGSERVAEALGAFNAQPGLAQEWACSGLQAQRFASRLRRGGWGLLSRTGWADLVDVLTRRQGHLVASLEVMPVGLAHGDLTPSNVMTQRGAELIVVDWATAGQAALGEDLGYYWLSVPRVPLETLVEAYVAGLLSTGRSFGGTEAALRRDVTRAARVVSVLTGFARAEWALSRVVGGEGPLAAKLSHPSVGRHLHALDRLRVHAEALIDLR